MVRVSTTTCSPNWIPQRTSRWLTELKLLQVLFLFHGRISRDGGLWANFLQLGSIFPADLASRPLQADKAGGKRLEENLQVDLRPVIHSFQWACRETHFTIEYKCHDHWSMNIYESIMIQLSILLLHCTWHGCRLTMQVWKIGSIAGSGQLQLFFHHLCSESLLKQCWKSCNQLIRKAPHNINVDAICITINIAHRNAVRKTDWAHLNVEVFIHNMAWCTLPWDDWRDYTPSSKSPGQNKSPVAMCLSSYSTSWRWNGNEERWS